MNSADNKPIDRKSQDQSNRDGSDPSEKTSPAGTHDKPELTDHHKTPGTGMLSDDDHDEVEGPSG
jgi:hypothetical protein